MPGRRNKINLFTDRRTYVIRIQYHIMSSVVGDNKTADSNDVSGVMRLQCQCRVKWPCGKPATLVLNLGTYSRVGQRRQWLYRRKIFFSLLSAALRSSAPPPPQRQVLWDPKYVALASLRSLLVSFKPVIHCAGRSGLDLVMSMVCTVKPADLCSSKFASRPASFAVYANYTVGVLRTIHRVHLFTKLISLISWLETVRHRLA